MQFMSWVTHEAETGGGPTGFGWGSFVTFILGISAIAFMLGRYLQARSQTRQRIRHNEGTSRTTVESALREDERTNFDPYDDLTRD